jgi:hypothetical protein
LPKPISAWTYTGDNQNIKGQFYREKVNARSNKHHMFNKANKSNCGTEKLEAPIG